MSIQKDSVRLSLDENYFLIEDSCSSIIRYVRYNGKDRKFYGSFHDVSSKNSNLIVSEGSYSIDGFLDGPFISRYLDGSLQATGKFSKGKMIGKWIINYPNNLRHLEFENINGIVHIENAWDETGKQTVINGLGNFTATLGRVKWVGKIDGGLPDGIWKFQSQDDRTGSMRVTENFKKGSFIKGSGPAGSYTDESRLTLADATMLPVYNASLMRISANNCDPTTPSRKKIVYAVYKNGTEMFSQEIMRVIQPVIAKIDLRNFNNKEFTIEGIVSPKGDLKNLKYVNTFDDRMSRSLLEALYSLPFLEPTLVDGVPTASGIQFKLFINDVRYRMTWKISAMKN